MDRQSEHETLDPYNSVYACCSSLRWPIPLFLLAAFGISTLCAQTAAELNRTASQALQEGKLDLALSALRTASRRFPDDAHINFNLGLALTRKGRMEEAIKPLCRAAHDPSLADEAHFLLGVSYFEVNEHAKVLKELSGLENSAHREQVLFMIEESSRRTGRIDEAKQAFHQLINQYPDSGWTHYLMGTAYEAQQQLDKAIDEYKQALGKDPAIPNANFAIGYIYWRQQDTEDAREWLKKEAVKGCHSLANFYLGEIARGERDLQSSEGLYRRALECDSSSIEAHLRLGIVLGDQKRYKEAITQLKEAVRLQPNESSAHYHLAALYGQTGQTGAAKAEYEKVRQIQAAKDNGVDVTGGDKH